MKKHNIYILFSVITILLMFVTAATCSFCGIHFDTNSSGQPESDSEQERENIISENTQAQITETENTGSSEDENTSEDEEQMHSEDEDSSAENDDVGSDEPEAGQDEDNEESSREINETVLGVVSNETGCINTGSTSGDAAYTNYIYIGDSTDDGFVSGYISFNITGLAGLEIVSAALNMNIYEELGDDLSFLGNLRIGAIQYGTGTLKLSDGNIPADLLVQLPNYTTNIRYRDDALADELQKNIDASNERLQLKIYWASPGSNNDHDADGLKYMKEDVSLTVQFIE